MWGWGVGKGQLMKGHSSPGTGTPTGHSGGTLHWQGEISLALDTCMLRWFIF